jgi:hypothetical protein
MAPDGTTFGGIPGEETLVYTILLVLSIHDAGSEFLISVKALVLGTCVEIHKAAPGPGPLKVKL